jgi:hypothetical protein
MKKYPFSVDIAEIMKPVEIFFLISKSTSLNLTFSLWSDKAVTSSEFFFRQAEDLNSKWNANNVRFLISLSLQIKGRPDMTSHNLDPQMLQKSLLFVNNIIGTVIAKFVSSIFLWPLMMSFIKDT